MEIKINHLLGALGLSWVLGGLSGFLLSYAFREADTKYEADLELARAEISSLERQFVKKSEDRDCKGLNSDDVAEMVSGTVQAIRDISPDDIAALSFLRFMANHDVVITGWRGTSLDISGVFFNNAESGEKVFALEDTAGRDKYRELMQRFMRDVRAADLNENFSLYAQPGLGLFETSKINITDDPRQVTISASPYFVRSYTFGPCVRGRFL